MPQAVEQIVGVAAAAVEAGLVIQRYRGDRTFVLQVLLEGPPFSVLRRKIKKALVVE
jgi:hypothetical protein